MTMTSDPMVYVCAVLMFGGFAAMTYGLGGNHKVYFSGVLSFVAGVVVLTVS